MSNPLRQRFNSLVWFAICCILLVMPVLHAAGQTSSESTMLNRTEYADRLRAMWLGQAIANWTGLTTEAVKEEPPFYTDADWGINQHISWKQNSVIDFVFQDPWLADDDTDIEYVYLTLMEQLGPRLSAEQIAAGWRAHINDFIWFSNQNARNLMERGALPPVTSMLGVNEYGLMIDAQLTTEIFGAIAPGMPAQALQLADLPIRTTASGHAAHAAQYYVLLYALAAQASPQQDTRDQIIFMVEEARRYIPDTSKVADIVDVVLADYLANPDSDDWERTRDLVYQRYQRDARDHGFVHRSWVESSVNFATGLIALLYGEGDFQRTVQIGTLSGWDSDNGTATMGGLLGLLKGYEAITAEFPEVVFSDRYKSSRTRDALPDHLPDDRQAEDTFAMMAERMLPIIDAVIIDAGGQVEANTWVLPAVDADPATQNPLSQLTLSSANNRILSAGGEIVTRVGTGASQSRTRVIADGAEHNYTGMDVRRPPRAFRAVPRDGSVEVEVMYDRLVDATLVRLIEGDPGLFSTLSLELYAEGQWVPAPDQTVVAAQPDPNIPYQQFDLVLPERMSVMGVRVTGLVDSGPLGDVMIHELDVFAEH